MSTQTAYPRSSKSSTSTTKLGPATSKPSSLTPSQPPDDHQSISSTSLVNRGSKGNSNAERSATQALRHYQTVNDVSRYVTAGSIIKRRPDPQALRRQTETSTTRSSAALASFVLKIIFHCECAAERRYFNEQVDSPTCRMALNLS
jgi:hypothetical protein